MLGMIFMEHFLILNISLEVGSHSVDIDSVAYFFTTFQTLTTSASRLPFNENFYCSTSTCEVDELRSA